MMQECTPTHMTQTKMFRDFIKEALIRSSQVVTMALYDAQLVAKSRKR